MYRLFNNLKVDGSTFKWLAAMLLISAFALQEKLQSPSIDSQYNLISSWSLDLENSFTDHPEPDHAISVTETVIIPSAAIDTNVLEFEDAKTRPYSPVHPRAPPSNT